MHAFAAATASAGLASVMLVSPPPRQPVSPARWEVTPSVAEVIFLRTATADDSLRAEARLGPDQVRGPLERYLSRFSADRMLVRRISRAVLRESQRQQVPPSLITAVLLTENTTLTPGAMSPVGARGLMQVMPMHAGAQLCRSNDLTDVDSNICHGTMILARNLRATRTEKAALLRYNGCVRGSNTPDCHLYPSKVLARASRVRREILAGTDGLALLATDSVAPVQLAER